MKSTKYTKLPDDDVLEDEEVLVDDDVPPLPLVFVVVSTSASAVAEHFEPAVGSSAARAEAGRASPLTAAARAASRRVRVCIVVTFLEEPSPAGPAGECPPAIPSRWISPGPGRGPGPRRSRSSPRSARCCPRS